MSSVVGLRLSDRKENTIEADFLVFLERREKDSSDWYKTYTPQKLSQELFTIFSEFRAGSGDLPLATFQNSAGAFDLDECTARGHSDCNRVSCRFDGLYKTNRQNFVVHLGFKMEMRLIRTLGGLFFFIFQTCFMVTWTSKKYSHQKFLKKNPFTTEKV